MKKHLLLASAAVLSSAPAFAQEAAHAAGGDKGLYAIGAAIALGAAALGGGLGQGKIGAAAMEGLARNPQARDSIFVPMIIALVFVETLVLFTFALSFLLQAKA